MPTRKRRAAGASHATAAAYDPSLSVAARVSSLRRGLLSRLNRRDTLLDMVRAVHATLEPDQIARAVIERAAGWMPLACWCIVAPDGQDQLTILSDDGLQPDFGPSLYAVAGWVMRHDAPFLSGNLAADDRVAVDLPASAIAMPLLGRDRVIAVLIGVDRATSREAPAFGLGLSRALTTLLLPAGLAIDSSLLLKRTEALSVTDDLTRLYNSRYLNIALRRESRLAARTGRSLSLLFIDLDGFKSINDNHGHLAGSRALVEAGAVIRGSARETDIVARFGGDEFALILPDTGSQGALAVAERIRDRLARHSFLAGDGLNIHLTASVGVATLPDVAVSADELVHAADAAMYRVKDRGKNGIQAAVSSR